MLNDAPDGPLTGPQLADALARAAEGLTYTSESDRPFTPVLVPRDRLPHAGRLTPEEIAALAPPTPRARVEGRTVDDALARHLFPADPSDDAAAALRPRYEALLALLRQHLVDLSVVRMGRIEVRCWFVGRDREGNLVGLETIAIET